MVGAGGLALAACSSAGGNSGTGTSTGAGTGTSTGAGNGTSAGTGGGATTSPSGPSALIALAKVPVGGSAAAEQDGAPVVIAQQTAGTVAAFSAICTHQGCTVKPAGAEYHCPCHGSKYNAFTGAVIQGPAPRPLHPIPVTVVGGTVTAT